MNTKRADRRVVLAGILMLAVSMVAVVAGSTVAAVVSSTVAAGQTAVDRLRRGLQMLEAGQETAAVQELRAAVALDGSSAEARYHLARALLAVGNAVEAEEHALAALERGAEEGPVRFLLAQVYLELTRWEEADAALREAASSRPGYAPISFYRGELCYRLGRVDGARALFEEAAETAPRWEAPRARLGVIALDEGEAETAIDRFREAIERSPNNPILWMRLATAYAALNDTAESLEAYRSATETGPRFIAAWRAYATQLQNLGENNKLPDVIEHMLDLQPGIPVALYLRATLEATAGDHEAALADVEAALEGFGAQRERVGAATEPEGRQGYDTAAAGLRAELLGNLGRTEEAEAVARHLIELDPDFPQAYFILGNILVRRRDEGGREPLTRFKTLTDAREHRDLGLYYLDMVDDPDRAEVEFDAALELEPYDGISLLGKARIARRRGELEQALGHLERAREHGAERDELYRAEILVLDALGRGQDALEVWRKADTAVGARLGTSVWRVVYRDVEVHCTPGTGLD